MDVSEERIASLIMVERISERGTTLPVKNAFFWDVTLCGFYRTDVSVESIVSIIRCQKNLRDRSNVTSEECNLLGFYAV
jgi:hypothetical protein